MKLNLYFVEIYENKTFSDGTELREGTRFYVHRSNKKYFIVKDDSQITENYLTISEIKIVNKV